MTTSNVISSSIQLIYWNEQSAPAKESYASRFRPLKHLCLAPYKVVMAFWTVANWKLYPSFPLAEQSPTLQKWCEKGAYLCGLNPTYPYTSELHLLTRPWSMESFNMPCSEYKLSLPSPKIPALTYHVIKDQHLNQKILKPHRNVDFEGQSGIDAFMNLLGSVFTETSFDQEDVMLTCGPDFTSVARMAIIKTLHQAPLDKIINAVSNDLISRWESFSVNEIPFDLTLETRLFSNSVITQALFGGCEECKELSDAVHAMNKYLFAEAIGTVNASDKEKFAISCKTFSRIVNQFIENNDFAPMPLFSHSDHPFTKAQMQALCLTMFFAGQETTGFGLDHLLAKLALNPSDQHSLRSEIQEHMKSNPENLNFLSIPGLKSYIDDRILEIPPAGGVERRLRHDTDITFKLTNGKKIGKFMRKGEGVLPYFNIVAEELLKKKHDVNTSAKEKVTGRFYHQKATIFGIGIHGCLGRGLALKELSQLPARILMKFEISTDEIQFKYTQQITNQANAFIIKVRPIL